MRFASGAFLFQETKMTPVLNKPLRIWRKIIEINELRWFTQIVRINENRKPGRCRVGSEGKRGTG